MSFLRKISNRFVCILLTAFVMSSFSLQNSPSREYRVKAAFLFNFTQFIEWPASSFTGPQSPAVIGILGKDPFGPYLEATVTGETIDKHPLIIKRFNSTDDITNCHVLFINMKNQDELVEILEKLKGKNILTVSDANGFAKFGGMIRMYTKNDKISFQINLEAAKAENLSISSKLLKLAEIVKTDKKQ